MASLITYSLPTATAAQQFEMHCINTNAVASRVYNAVTVVHDKCNAIDLLKEGKRLNAVPSYSDDTERGALISRYAKSQWLVALLKTLE